MDTANSKIDENIGIELLYRARDISDIEFDLTPDIQMFIDKADLLDVNDITLSSQKVSMRWLMPEEYQNLDVVSILRARCSTQPDPVASLNRVEEELSIFTTRKLIPVLRLLVYIIDTMRKNKIVWGVGRGSSVSSYCLYLLDVHRIDSLAYDLDITEFLK